MSGLGALCLARLNEFDVLTISDQIDQAQHRRCVVRSSSLIVNQIRRRVLTPTVVHAVQSIRSGYCSRLNSASFCLALT